MDRLIGIPERTGPRDDWDARFAHALASRHLLSHRRHGIRRWPDEDDAALLARTCELLVLTEKTVAGMNRLSASGASRVDDPVDDEIRLCRRRWADLHRLVGEQHECGGAVGIAVHGDCSHAEVAAPAEDPQRDLTTVGDEDFVEHQATARMLVMRRSV